jgi:hypothetical protein
MNTQTADHMREAAHPIASLRIHVPLVLNRRSGRRHVERRDPHGNGPTRHASQTLHADPMTITIARAFRWKGLLDDGTYASIAQMAASLGINRWYMSRIIRLTLIAPDIIESIVQGTAPDGISMELLRKPMPLNWEEQKRVIGLRDSLTG